MIMTELTNDPDFIPYDSLDYERDEHGNIKIYNPEPEPDRNLVFTTGGYSPPEPLIVELREIKDLLKQILNKLR